MGDLVPSEGQCAGCRASGFGQLHSPALRFAEQAWLHGLWRHVLGSAHLSERRGSMSAAGTRSLCQKCKPRRSKGARLCISTRLPSAPQAANWCLHREYLAPIRDRAALQPWCEASELTPGFHQVSSSLSAEQYQVCRSGITGSPVCRGMRRMGWIRIMHLRTAALFATLGWA